MKFSENFVKEHVEHVDPPFTILNGIIEPLEFLSINLPMAPH
jgi:hypothetical protein